MTEPDNFLRLPEVIDIAKFSKSMIYKLIRAGRFPKPYKPCDSSSSRWSEREVREWKAAQQQQPVA